MENDLCDKGGVRTQDSLLLKDSFLLIDSFFVENLKKKKKKEPSTQIQNSKAHSLSCIPKLIYKTILFLWNPKNIKKRHFQTKMLTLEIRQNARADLVITFGFIISFDILGVFL